MENTSAGNLRRLGGLIALALLGLSFAVAFDFHNLEQSLWYGITASLLLSVGLFMAVAGIDKQEARREWRVVTVAVTIGVLCKYALIFGALYLAIWQWQYAVLAMAMAQIDPLSVAALASDSRMSVRTKTVLAMWASFDDPMTALATPLIVNLTGAALVDTNAHSSFSTIYGIAALAASTLVLLYVHYKRGLRLSEVLTNRRQTAGAAAAIAVGTSTKLFLAPALAGLIFRPTWLMKHMDRVANGALCGATLLLGLLLAKGVDWKGGLLLGVATYCSQIVVSWLVLWTAAKLPGAGTGRFSRRDAWHLALAQQNGITAIVLALNIEPQIPGAIATISFAIVTVNLLHFAANWCYDRFVQH